MCVCVCVCVRACVCDCVCACVHCVCVCVCYANISLFCSKIFIKDNQEGADTTVLQYIGLYGNILDATNMKDFKRVSKTRERERERERETYNFLLSRLLVTRERHTELLQST